MVKSSKTKTSENEQHKPILTVTAQQSRFHTDAKDWTTGREVTVKGLSVSIGDREILSHAELHLQPGRHYVLVGRNGVGKSTLLQAIAGGFVPAIPQSMRILLLGQIQDTELDGKEHASTKENTVLQHVIRSNAQRELLLHEAKILTNAIEGSQDAAGIVRVYHELRLERLKCETAKARLIAERRSAARGLRAHKALIQLEQELSDSTERLQNLVLEANEDREADTLAQETQCAHEMLADVQMKLEAMQASSAEAQARSVLLGLGFSEERFEKPMDQLSGGWRTRCSLAWALCQSCDLLLLDEPTNFLDLHSIMWLESYIKNMDPATTVILVTHDRAFADAVGDQLLILRNFALETFNGTVFGYEVDRMKTYKYLSRMQEAQDKQKKHMAATIEHNKQAAKRAGDDKKLKQAASRQRKLDERMGMEVSAKGTRFKLNRDLAGYHSSRRDEIEVPTFDPPARMAFPMSPADLRFPGALLWLENIVFAYPRLKQPILRDASLTIHYGDRIGLVGLNGSGKSTLVSLAMAGVQDGASSMSPNKDIITRHGRARFGLYSQQAVEQLDKLV